MHWNWTIRYLRERDFDFAYWSVDGEHFPALAVTNGEQVPNLNREETYGLLEDDYRTVRHTWKLQDIQSLMVARTSGAAEGTGSRISTVLPQLRNHAEL